jgi:hypothetical protein
VKKEQLPEDCSSEEAQEYEALMAEWDRLRKEELASTAIHLKWCFEHAWELIIDDLPSLKEPRPWLR